MNALHSSNEIPPTPLPSPTKNTTSFPGCSPTRLYGGRSWERRCQKHWVCKQTIQPKNPVSVSNATNISSEKISKLWVYRPLEDVYICGNIRGGRGNLSLAWWHFLDSKPEFFVESNEPLVYMVNTEKINYISCPYHIMTWSICYEEPADEKACRLPIWLNPDWMWATWISTLFWKQLKEKI